MSVKRINWNDSSLKIFGIVLLMVGAVLFLWFLLRGEVNVTGNYPGEVTSNSMSCEKGNYIYEYFNEKNFSDSFIKINMLFDGNEIKSIALIYTEKYGSKSEADVALNLGHANLNKNFGAEFGADAFNANYVASNNEARVSLYTIEESLNSPKARTFFLINGPLKTTDEYKANYEEQGFECVVKNK